MNFAEKAAKFNNMQLKMVEISIKLALRLIELFWAMDQEEHCTQFTEWIDRLRTI